MKHLLGLMLVTLASPVMADPIEITEVVAQKGTNGWRFDVTILHPDTGWDHYVDGWVVRTEDGTELGARPLAHPHETEQPFTRSVSGVVIPEDIETVYIFANCSQDGETSPPFAVKLSP